MRPTRAIDELLPQPADAVEEPVAPRVAWPTNSSSRRSGTSTHSATAARSSRVCSRVRAWRSRMTRPADASSAARRVRRSIIPLAGAPRSASSTQ